MKEESIVLFAKNLECFMMVVKEGYMKKSAEKLCVTQSPFS